MGFVRPAGLVKRRIKQRSPVAATIHDRYDGILAPPEPSVATSIHPSLEDILHPYLASPGETPTEDHQSTSDFVAPPIQLGPARELLTHFPNAQIAGRVVSIAHRGVARAIQCEHVANSSTDM